MTRMIVHGWSVVSRGNWRRSFELAPPLLSPSFGSHSAMWRSLKYQSPCETVQHATLYTGAKMPLVGLGTWLSVDPNGLKTALRAALDAGYRYIDTAHVYGNEGMIGDVLQEYFEDGRLKREDIFITTKLPFYHMEPLEAQNCIEEQLLALKTDYVDLYLIHHPCAMKPKDPTNPTVVIDSWIHEEIPHIDTWRVLERYYNAGVFKAIGLSNFNKKQIMNIYNNAEVKPANLQVECHIYWPQFELRELCKELGMTMTAYSSLGNPGRKILGPNEYWPEGNVLEDLLVLKLAEKYARTPAQILLRHLTQRGISVIPKSTNARRVAENFNIFDFEITPEDNKKLESVQKRVRLIEFRYCKGNKEYPFEDVDLDADLNELRAAQQAA